MAERRMFAKTIIDSDAFLDMPLSAQSLYFHLSMRADDDGFINNPRKIQRMIGASDDDLKLLIAKSFLIPFETGIVVIKHWRIHNYIRGDRKKSTVYSEEYAMLDTKENGAYTIANKIPALEEISQETARQKAYRESSLPYSFEYKIRQVFWGRKCPICGSVMSNAVDEDGIGSNNRIPTIQHNIPISKGGKHELGNISVICKQCNISIQDQETGKLNADEVVLEWDKICGVSQMSGTCQSDDSQMSAQVRLGKDSIGKDSIEGHKSRRFVPPTLQEVSDYCKERHNGIDPERFIDFYQSKNWMIGKNKISDWKACVRTWEKRDKAESNSKSFETSDLDKFINNF